MEDIFDGCIGWHNEVIMNSDCDKESDTDIDCYSESDNDCGNDVTGIVWSQ